MKMPRSDVTGLTRKYLEAKYDVDLSDVIVKKPLYHSFSFYDTGGKVAVVPQISNHAIAAAIVSVALPPLSTIVDGIVGQPSDPAVRFLGEALGVMSTAISSYCAAAAALSFNMRESLAAHELTHAVTDKLTYPEDSFDEALALHEGFRSPGIPARDRWAHRISYWLFPIHQMPKYRRWQEMLSWMDGSSRKERISGIKDRLDYLGSPDAGQLCAELYEMGPRQYVEEHRLLRGLQRYSRSGNPIHFSQAREDFMRHGGDTRAADKYIALMRKAA